MKDLITKLNNVQKTIGTLTKDAKNPFHKNEYLTLNALLDAVIPVLQKEGLTLLQPISDDRVCTRVYLGEEFIESGIPLPNDINPQHIGSAITYYRRYSLMSLLCLQAEDDDGNQASVKPDQKPKDELPWLNEGTAEFTKVKEYLDKGGNMSEVYTKFKVSNKVKALLQ